MKVSVLYSILFVFLSTLFNINAQENKPVGSTADTIVYLGGRSIPVIVANVTSSKVFYTNIDESTIFETDRKQVEKIVYRTGRVDILNRPVFQMISEDDWKNVFITQESGEVAGLYERGPVEVTAAASRNRKSTIRNAEIRLKRQAAALKANLVLVTDTEFRGGYGDIPSITMRGIAYGFEPLPEIDEEQSSK